MPPLVQAFPVDGLADLFGTRGAYAAFIFVKLKAGTFEGQPAVLQDTAHAAVQIIDHVFVLYAEHCVWQDCVPVLHEAHIVAVVPSNVGQAVGEFLA